MTWPRCASASRSVHSARQAWWLEGFEECLDRWIEIENPPTGLTVLVADWVFTRAEDPYQGVRREVGFDNLWYGPVPGSGHGQGEAVACSYWVEERNRIVRCNSISTLGQPI